MAKEIEIKFLVRNGEGMVNRLLEAGARKVSEGLEHNIVFDDGEMVEKGTLLRLRKTSDGKSVLTFKRNVRKAEFKEADEMEIGISDLSKAKKILLNLGYRIFWVYEKRKSVFKLGSVLVSLDQLPFATFMEIEGGRTDIRIAIKKLGLDPKKGMTKTYLELYQDYCNERKIKMENLVFWKKYRPEIR